MNKKFIPIVMLILSAFCLTSCTSAPPLSLATDGEESVGVPTEVQSNTQGSSIVHDEDYQPIADLNKDGKSNIADVSHLLNVLARGDQDLIMDINGDGELNIADVSTLLNILSGSDPNTGIFSFEKNEDEGYYTITGIADPIPARLYIPGEYQGLPVKKIAGYAFYGRTGIRYITIPSQVEEIGSYAFNGCLNVSSIFFSEGLKIIDSNAFASCVALKELNIPASVEMISPAAFADCSSLTTLKCAEANTAYQVLSGCLIEKKSNTLILGCKNSVIPEGEVTTIAAKAFAGCTGLKEMTIPDCVTSIGGAAFQGCTGLETVTIEAALENIPAQAFQNCSALREVTLPEGLVSIDSNAFSYCNALSEIKLPTTVTTIGRYAFEHCAKLKEITIPAGVTVLSEGVFRQCTGLTAFTVSEGVTEIGTKAFYGCSALKSLHLPKSLTKVIPEDSFVGCNPDSITVASGNKYYTVSGNCLVYLPKKLLVKAGNGCTIPIDGSVTTIGSYAFAGCTGIERLVLPEGLKEFGSNSFADCKDLKVLVYPGSKESWAGLMRGFNWNKGSDFVMEFEK